MNFVFLMDPLHTVIMEKDTSFILMLGAHQRGHKVFYLADGGITLKNGRFQFEVLEVEPRRQIDSPFLVKKKHMLTDDEVHAVFIRSDPPFDQQYLINTWLLDRLPARIPVINKPAGIRAVNEKIWATQFVDLIPKTLISRSPTELLAFLNEEGEIVAKPTDGFGGQGVFHVKKGDKNANVILETLTEHYKRDIILQKFIAEASQGDKRILLLNGEPLGAVLRIQSIDDHRNNFFSGGKPVKTEITETDLRIIAVLKPHLQNLGLNFVGIDVIGGYLIEVNVTSPTCLQEINLLEGKHLENEVIAFVEKLTGSQC